MFWNIFYDLCVLHKTKPNPVAKKLGISSGAVTAWKNGKVPHHETLIKIADYFGVTVDYLLGQEEKEPSVTIDGELEEDVIIFHRDGKTQKKKLTAEQRAIFMAMIDALPDTSKDDI